MGATLDRFIGKFNQFKSLSAGETFSIEVTDKEATEAAREYLAENTSQVKQLIQNAAKVSLDVADPKIVFSNDEITMGAKGGKGFLKVNASLNAGVVWNGGLKVDVRSVDIPVIKVTPEKLHPLVEKVIGQGMDIVKEYAEIESFRITNGSAVLKAVRK